MEGGIQNCQNICTSKQEQQHTPVARKIALPVPSQHTNMQPTYDINISYFIGMFGFFITVQAT